MRQLINDMQDDYVPPRHSTVRAMITLATAKSIALTQNNGASDVTKGYVGVTAHYIYEEEETSNA
jgi:hypothetical protein